VRKFALLWVGTIRGQMSRLRWRSARHDKRILMVSHRLIKGLALKWHMAKHVKIGGLNIRYMQSCNKCYM